MVFKEPIKPNLPVGQKPSSGTIKTLEMAKKSNADELKRQKATPTTKPANKAQLAKEQQMVKEHRMLQKGKAMDQFKKQVTSGKITKATKDMPLEQRMYLKKKVK